MAYLRNRTVNLINLHYGFQAFANGAGGIFVIAYFIEAGLSIAAALCAMALIYAGRFVVRPIVLVIAKRYGLKPTLIIGTVLSAVPFLFLARVDGIGWPLLAYCLTSALGQVFYWSCYHAYFAALGDNEHRGHQVSAREALAAIIGIVAPLIGGWSLVTLGPVTTFAVIAIVEAAGALPLLLAPNVPVLREATGTLRAARLSMMLFAADGWLAVMFIFTWQIALFLSLGESFANYGGAMAIAALVGAASGMLLGRYIDSGQGRTAALIAYGALSLTLLLRAASVGDPYLVLAANAAGAIAAVLQPSAMMSLIYNLAKASPCPLRFQIACEGGWDAGAVTGLLTAAALAALDTPLSLIITLGLLSIATTVFLMSRHYTHVALSPLRKA